MRPIWEYDIYVPTVNTVGERYAAKLLGDWEQRVIELFGGLTKFTYRNEGSWKVGGLVVRDEVYLWRVLSERGEEGDKFMRTLKGDLERALAQDEILVVRRAAERLEGST